MSLFLCLTPVINESYFCRPKTSQLTQVNLTSHDTSKTTRDLTPEKQTMRRFHQEHDLYRRFLVTGDTTKRQEQLAKYDGMNEGTSGNELSTQNT